MRTSSHFLKCVLVNTLTGFRLLAAAYYLTFGEIPLTLTSGLILCVAILTDVLDGFTARALGCTTSFGRYFDVAADKLFVIAVLLKAATISPSVALVVSLVSTQYLLLGLSAFVLYARGNPRVSPTLIAKFVAGLSYFVALYSAAVPSSTFTIGVGLLLIGGNLLHNYELLRGTPLITTRKSIL